MPAVDSINGVEAANVDSINGAEKSDIDELMGGLELGDPIASAWYVGSSGGKIFRTTTANASGGWEELVDVGSAVFVSTAIGQDNSGNERIMFNAKTNTLNIAYANTADDLSDSDNWTTPNLSLPIGSTGQNLSPKGNDYGRTSAFGNGVWMHANLMGATGEDPQNYEGLTRSTDGGANWTVIELNNTVNTGQYAIAHKGGTSNVWLLSLKDRVWTSSDNGLNWTDRGVVVSGKKIYDFAYNSNQGRWVCVMDGNKIATSDDDGVNWTERTSSQSGSNQINSIVFMKGSVQLYIAGGQNGRLLRSSDGVSWTNNLTGTGDWGSNIIYSIATDHTTCVMVGGGGQIAHSTDGINWTVLDPAVSGFTTAYRCITSNIIGAGHR